MADQGLSFPPVASAVTFVNNGTALSLEELFTRFPPNGEQAGKFANVSDLYGTVTDTVRCRFDGVDYKWVPQREAFNSTVAAAGGTFNVVPLVTPPMIRFTSSLTGNMNVTFTTPRAYIGQRQRIMVTGLLGLYGFTVGGIIGSNVSLLTGGVKDFEFGVGGWFAAS